MERHLKKLCNLVGNTISQNVSAQNKRKLSRQKNGQKLMGK